MPTEPKKWSSFPFLQNRKHSHHTHKNGKRPNAIFLFSQGENSLRRQKGLSETHIRSKIIPARARDTLHGGRVLSSANEFEPCHGFPFLIAGQGFSVFSPLFATGFCVRIYFFFLSLFYSRSDIVDVFCL